MELIALHRNPLLRIKELGPQEYKSNKKFEVPVKLTVRRHAKAVWYDVRSGQRLAEAREVSVVLQPFEPTFLAAFPEEPGPFRVSVDLKARRIVITPPQPCAMDASTYHLEFIGPDGKHRLVYRRNFTCPPGGGSVEIPLALNDTPGQWTVSVREVATGRQVRVPFEFKP